MGAGRVHQPKHCSPVHHHRPSCARLAYHHVSDRESDVRSQHWGVTAANGTTLRTTALTTQSAAVAADQDVENKGDARQVAMNALTSKSVC